MTGNSSANLLRAGYASSILRGMSGNDTLSSSLGVDTMTGGAGRDTFVFNTKVFDLIVSRDRITDFKPVDDTIYLENSAFKKIGKGTSAKPGKLNKAFFKVGAKAGDTNDYVGYDRTNGILWYDADGSGQGAAVKIATLPKKLKMSALDFFVI
jgi:Ca2+-binding RTX toxin-like protein